MGDGAVPGTVVAMEGGGDSQHFDCRACGACCMDAHDGRILVAQEDLVRGRREGRVDVLDGLVEGHFGQQGFPAQESGRCTHLGAGSGDLGDLGDLDDLDCSIYPTRGAACRQVQPGDRQCLEYRRRFGVDSGD